MYVFNEYDEQHRLVNSIQVSSESSCSDVVDAFKRFLYAATYAPQTIEEALRDNAKELIEEWAYFNKGK